MKRIIIILAIWVSWPDSGRSQQNIVRLPPPKIVETSPKAWDTQVNPTAVNEIAITFDQAMVPAFTAWLGESGLPPDLDLHSSKTTPDRKAFRIKASLEPGRVYVLALNESGVPGAGFQNDKGVSSAPFFLVFQTVGNIAPASMPPRVASTIPTNNAQQLDPSKLKSVTVVFDKPMRPAKHGLHMLENKKEVDLSKARFQYSGDGKSFTLGYDFKPSTVYEFQLNSTQDIGFTSAKRVPLWPVSFAFSTGSPR